MGNSKLLMTRKRLSAFIKAIGDNAEIIICHADNAEEAGALTLAALSQQPDAVFCMSDEVLTGAMKTIQRSALRVPEDISVIALSNGFIPKLYYPEISYVETSGYTLGKLAFSSMMECLAGGSSAKELTTEAMLVEGGSL